METVVILVNDQIAAISTKTFTIDDLSLNFGANEITLEAIDFAGNSTRTSLNITLDGTASAVYSYDPDGNLITNSLKGTTWNYAWDTENRLINAASSLGKNIEYTYYEDGMLGKKETSSSSDTVYYIYDGIHCIAEYDGANGFIKEIIYGPQIDEVLCTIDEYSSARYYHQDALQSVVAVTDGFRNKIAAYEYDVYGKIRSSEGSFPAGSGTGENPITYTGRWLDSDTGLYYYRARWYDADVGRFISRDPIGVAGGINLYGYVGGNPTDYSDPKGLIKKSMLCKIKCATVFVLELVYCNLPFCPPDPQCMSNAYTRFYICLNGCFDDSNNLNDDNQTPNVPAVIPHRPPVVWGGSGHVMPPFVISF